MAPNPIFSPTFASPGLAASVFISFIDLDAKLYCNCIPCPAIKLNISFGVDEVTMASFPLCNAPVAAVELTLILPKPTDPCILILPEPNPPIISHWLVSNTPCVVLTFALHQAKT